MAQHVRPIDAVIVPSARPAESLRSVIRAAAEAGVLLVVLSSKESTSTDVAVEVERVAGVAAVLVELPPDRQVPVVTHLETSDHYFHKLSADRHCDLSVKRNLGLMLARLCGWSKVLFLDDDIAIRARDIHRLAAQLEQTPMAAFRPTRFPDNSVVSHADRRITGRRDVFVSGAALGVNTADQPLPFFPDVYNEDWFAFADPAVAGELGWAGDLGQWSYDPFDDPVRARRQEFGDVLAEGLYAQLAAAGSPTETGDDTRWSAILSKRADLVAWLLDRSERAGSTHQAASLRAAADQLGVLHPYHCVDFLGAWRRDRAAWVDATQRLSTARSLAEALDRLGLTEWVANSTRCGSVASRRPAARVTTGPS